MDRGPWQVIEPEPGKHGWIVGSDDFEHDVWLTLSGDFPDDFSRRAYCQWLCIVLNQATATKEVE